MGRLWGWMVILLITTGIPAPVKALADELSDTTGWQRVDSRYCTFWIEPGIEVEKINDRINVRGIRTRFKVPKDSTNESQLAAKCDILFRRAEEILDMYPAGIHISIKVFKDHKKIARIHEKEYGRSVEAIAFYLFQTNTVYAVAKKISEDVLIHEMGHSIIDHYFGVRPPRKIEELLAMHVDAVMRE